MFLTLTQLLLIIFAVVCAFLLMIFFFFGVIVRNVNIRRKNEIETFNAVLQTQEHERKRIAVDLHDEIGPLLSGVKLQIGTFGLIEDKNQLREAITETSGEFDRAMREIRNAIANLSPTRLRQIGLIQTISQFGKTIESKGTIQFHVDAGTFSAVRPMEESAEINIYRIVQELINNSLKHSNCTEINLSLELQNQQFIIRYHDNGKIVPGPAATQADATSISTGMGMTNIRSRAKLLNGKIESAADFRNGANYVLVFDQINVFENS